MFRSQDTYPAPANVASLAYWCAPHREEKPSRTLATIQSLHLNQNDVILKPPSCCHCLCTVNDQRTDSNVRVCGLDVHEGSAEAPVEQCEPRARTERGDSRLRM
ncbi:uncharacterized protein B0H18DRAFT_587772 [Fomitopsis serialis]|uniref:uncharacterized protein n=1 Tax=Fomitopsis serialis TaxID=139415 RepID=UPI00200722F4|nr:uncharacterized protein B0H18DRAFT_587772 [Neoantrodia serialis]KAH9907660.1 hypothetical protein B0H18DRAFT_587772 [Neoantrodia serialis]